MATGSASRSSVDFGLPPQSFLTNSNWRISWDGPATGAENMAKDLALFEAAEADPTTPPVFRLYAWDPPCISVGFHQDPAKVLDLSQVEVRGYDLVKRPTGGRAILHDQELTYMVVSHFADAWVGGSLAESHFRVTRILHSALVSLGIAANFADTRREWGPALGSNAAAPCFASATRSELLLAGRKLLGSAQRRGTRAFLQHGSLLFGAGHLDLAECLHVRDRNKYRLALEKGSIELGDSLQPNALIMAIHRVVSSLGSEGCGK
jgi:lipoate-protein ligase A